MKPPMRPQELNMELLRISSFNEMDGQQVYYDLLTHKEWWTAIYYTCEGCALPMAKNERPVIHGDLICLRDMATDSYNGATLFIIPENGHSRDIQTLARKKWNADEVWELDKAEASSRLGTTQPPTVVRIWWD